MLENSKEIASGNGKLIVGYLLMKLWWRRKVIPILSFDEMFNLAKAIKYVDVVVPQETYSPLTNLMSIKPDVLIVKSKP